LVKSRALPTDVENQTRVAFPHQRCMVSIIPDLIQFTLASCAMPILRGQKQTDA
jgi:hypothetical protein